jgi:hypothetical protein
MQIKELLLGIPVLFFVFWIFTAPLPQERISRVCEPIHWVGNLATSTTALSSAKHTETSARWSDKLNYSCQYLIWRLFYQDDYNNAIKAGVIAAPSTDPVPATGEPTPAEDAGAEKVEAPASQTAPAAPERKDTP